MDVMIPAKQTHEGFCSFHCIQSNNGARTRIGTRVSANFSSEKGFLASKISYIELSVDFPDLKKDRVCRKQEKKKNLVYAVSKDEPLAINGRVFHNERNSGRRFEDDSSSWASAGPTYDEFESNNYLRRLVRNGELDEAFKYLESMVYRGDIPDIIPCTSLIRGFCRMGKTRKSTRVLEILEESGAVPNVITYNVLISGYCKAGEMDNALKLLDRMSVAPDVVTYNTILRSLCDSGKLKQAMRVLGRQMEREC